VSGVVDLDRLPPMAVGARVGRLRAAFADASCDALLVTRLTNVRYLSGFTGSAGLLLVTGDDLLLVTDGRYRDQSVEQLAAAGVDGRVEITGTGQRDVLTAATGAASVARLGLEAGDVTWAQQRRYADEWFADLELVPTESMVERLRRIKDDGEVARIEAACAIADAALAEVRPRLGEGLSEQAFGLELDTAIRRLGASGNSFETIVASGPNGAKPHARPTSRQVQQGDLVVLDFGALVDGYCSDMTRTVLVGEGDDVQQRMVDVVGASQQAGVAAVGPGVACADVDAACRDVIDDAGWGDAFLHSTGHGVGLDIHEDPRVSKQSEVVLEPGMVVTVEPGVYLPGQGGVRIDDTVVVTEAGCRRLTNAPKTATL
jgi:Xaa-Pro aminopeptidase